LILKDPPKLKDPAVATLNADVGQLAGPQQNKLSPDESTLSSVLRIEITPWLPHGAAGHTDMNVQLHYNDQKHICWNISGA
jgi:hypothetical protein